MPIQAIFSGASSLKAQTTSLDNTANNLANVNTTGFKRGRTEFQDLFYSAVRAPGAQVGDGLHTPVGIEVGRGVAVSAIVKDFSQGNVELTGQELDVAVDGEGFLRVINSEGEIRYTRDGSFKITPTGQIVNSDGLPIEPAITIPDGALSVSIGPTGVVEVEPATAPGTFVEVGQIETATFINPQGLAAAGGNLFAETIASGDPMTGIPGTEGRGTILQGFLEGSNVDVVEEVIDLITAQNAFEASTRVIQVSSEMLRTANEMFR